MNKSSCFHCGLPNPSQPQSLTIDGQARYFCCIGCHSAAKTIIDAGLGDYYKFHQPDQLPAETALTQKQKQALALYDQADVQAEFVSTLDEVTNGCILSIEGISCSACSWLIEKRLQQMPGVVSAQVNIGTHRLTLAWQHDITQLSELIHALVLIGYRAAPFLPSDEEVINQKTQRQYILRLGIAGIGMMQAMMNAVALYSGSIEPQHMRWLWWTGLFLTIPVMLISARPFFTSAWHALRQRQLTMDVSVSLAILSAFIASCYATISGHGEVYFESVNMFTFFLVLSRFLEFRARTQSNRGANRINHFLPQTCTLVHPDGSREVAIKTLKRGDIIQLLPGEVCPVDGAVHQGFTQFDESSFTGEFHDVGKAPGDSVFAGTTNRSQAVLIAVSASNNRSSFHLLRQLIERASAEKPRLAQLADKGARQFIWTTLFIALLIGLVWLWLDPTRAFWIVISVLVVTCPCALSLATPTALARATLTLKDKGLVITRGYALERLAKLSDIAFDKTGTLTEGRFALQDIRLAEDNPITADTKQLFTLARELEQQSPHSIADAFREQAPVADNPFSLRQITNHASAGISAQSSVGHWKLGSATFAGVTAQSPPPHITAVYLSLDERLVATFYLSDSLRSTVARTFEQLSALGITSHVITGDANPDAEQAMREKGLTGEYLAGLKPEDKVAWVKDRQHKQFAALGDGINDAPVLAATNLSIAMLEATDLTKSQADILLLTNHLPTLADAIRLAKKTNRIIRQNLFWALVYNAVALPVAAAGLVSPWQAAIGMSVSSLLVVGNAMRLTK